MLGWGFWKDRGRVRGGLWRWVGDSGRTEGGSFWKDRGRVRGGPRAFSPLPLFRIFSGRKLRLWAAWSSHIFPHLISECAKKAKCVCVVLCLADQSCPTLWDPMDCGPPGSSVRGILQARVLVWVALPSSRGSSWPRDWISISFISCIGRQVLYH